MAVSELVMNFSPNIPAVPATLFFVALIKYLAWSTFQRLEDESVKKFHWDLPRAFPKLR